MKICKIWISHKLYAYKEFKVNYWVTKVDFVICNSW